MDRIEITTHEDVRRRFLKLDGSGVVDEKGNAVTARIAIRDKLTAELSRALGQLATVKAKPPITTWRGLLKALWEWAS